jgi:hypothetical protein
LHQVHIPDWRITGALMEKIQEKISLKQSSLGEAAADGLFAGVIAGLVMAVFLLVAGWILGRGLTDTLLINPVGATSEPSLGFLSHLAVSGVYGVVFGLAEYVLLGKWLKDTPPGSSALLGLTYGVLLWALAAIVLLPGSASPMQILPPLILLIAHMIFGLVLSVLVSRRRKS